MGVIIGFFKQITEVKMNKYTFIIGLLCILPVKAMDNPKTGTKHGKKHSRQEEAPTRNVSAKLEDDEITEIASEDEQEKPVLVEPDLPEIYEISADSFAAAVKKQEPKAAPLSSEVVAPLCPVVQHVHPVKTIINPAQLTKKSSFLYDAKSGNLITKFGAVPKGWKQTNGQFIFAQEYPNESCFVDNCLDQGKSYVAVLNEIKGPQHKKLVMPPSISFITTMGLQKHMGNFIFAVGNKVYQCQDDFERFPAHETQAPARVKQFKGQEDLSPVKIIQTQNDLVVTLNETNIFKIWQKKGEEYQLIRSVGTRTGAIKNFCYHNGLIFFSCGTKSISVLSIDTGIEKQIFTPEDVMSLHIDNANKTLFVGQDKGMISVISCINFLSNPVPSFRIAHEKAIAALTYDAKRKIIVSCTKDEDVTLILFGISNI